jgi:hypothetical protein
VSLVFKEDVGVVDGQRGVVSVFERGVDGEGGRGRLVAAGVRVHEDVGVRRSGR